MDMKRIIRHLFTTDAQLRRAFPHSALESIEHTIQASEDQHLGEIRFAVEGSLDGMPLFNGQSPRERAIAVFSQLQIWDTEQNNGLLIYLLLADRAVEIVADRGINAKVDLKIWVHICQKMEKAFSQSNFESGVINGIQEITQQLIQHFPATGSGRNELSNEPVVL